MNKSSVFIRKTNLDKSFDIDYKPIVKINIDPDLPK
jgi:hypothetical protein